MGKTIKDSPLPEVMQAARFIVSHRKPYTSHALWAIIPREVEPGTLPPGSSMGVDKYWRLYYDRAVVETLSAEACAAAWYHEMWHLLDHTAARQEDAKAFAMMVNPKTGQPTVSVWNLASDMSINSRLQDETHEADTRGDAAPLVPLPDWVYPSTFGYDTGLLTEVYYDKLCQDTPPYQGQSNGQGACGSGAGGAPGAHEDPAPERGGFTGQGKHNTVPGVTAGEAEGIRRAVAEQVVKSRGNVPAWMTRWADRLLNPTVDWRKVLAGVVRGSLATTLSGYAERTYRRPHRRYAHTNIIVPTWYRPAPAIAVVGDTSGSMGDAELAIVIGETDGICRAASASVTFLSVDAAVGAVQKVASGRDVKLVGGGGTDMGVGIAAAEALKPRVHLIIVITDGYTPWPADAPTVPVVIALVGKKDPSSFELPAWARVVHCHDDE